MTWYLLADALWTLSTKRSRFVFSWTRVGDGRGPAVSWKAFVFLCAPGYCGADIKALCTEAALIALRRRYPQIYMSSQKLQLDVSSVVLSAQDFYHAMQNIVPASQRAVTSSGHALSPVIRPLLERTFTQLLHVLHKVFPHAEFSHADKSEGAWFGFFGKCCFGFQVLWLLRLALNLVGVSFGVVGM